MPIYEYRCLECGEHLEKLQKASDDPLTVCDSCGGKLEKQWSLSGFQFKGEGWYVTDYAGKKADKGEKVEKDAEKKSTSDSTDSSETASKKETKEVSKPKKEKAPASD